VVPSVSGEPRSRPTVGPVLCAELIRQVREMTDHAVLRPWFEYYGADAAALGGSSKLAGLKSVFQMGKEKRGLPLPENESVEPENVVRLRRELAKDQVREGSF
jgi:hypothetical protein